ncbi:ROK family transcriptional regulator [Amycolatopsis mediterranei S699]|uniref:ROK family transcriptional regulator n=2 Tax=Amycolatopsis mediterranei TaxID=33910 RepID=A0A0H3DIN5_AMYMU|nr:ROK family transcriptional regulator [Amycolatopsis mediterranei]ADJ49534.1 ROK family transcriptional regulator [Amycolatopsis mediterranei U32]AEK46512.1 ROK family transcriptional regulator [Amycolatopsis mediterranei S699]AFO81243.1 ROK family transcriptional regulator [Amycolatopsis mediterranei S699]AGT88371.1 ROK family transcriptional regulator [Amycolatopsis mediterranei RB]KDO04931.1 ROK family transcriptional regulator [Amycolatopsis mediterranei]
MTADDPGSPPSIGPVPRLAATTWTGTADGTRAQIFAEVLTFGPISRIEVARRLGLSQSTVTKAVTPLIDSGYLVEAGSRVDGPGRPQRLIRVAAGRYHAIGVQLGPAGVTGVLTDLRANTLTRLYHPLPEGHEPHTVLAAAAGLIGRLRSAAPRGLLGVGVSLGGHVDPATGRCVHSGILGWDDINVAALLTTATGLPIVVNNDVNAVVIAEQWFGAGRGVRSFAVVAVSAGIGCGLLLNGELHTGATGLAGEFGHLPLNPGGPPCSCGNTGCLEAVAADPAVIAATAAQGGPRCDSTEEVAALARSGNAAALAAYTAMGEALGRGLAALCNLLNLGKIILTGHGMKAFDVFESACLTAFHRHAFSTAATDCELTLEPGGDDLWARGAACLVIREAAGAAHP